MNIDWKWMGEALVEARAAAGEGEVPVGAVVVGQGRVVGRGRNRCEAKGDPLAHAEMEALGRAAGMMGKHGLRQCALYVTVEPCLMCLGACLLARIPKVVYGAREPRTGACRGAVNMEEVTERERFPVVIGGCREEECRMLMERFFRPKR